MKKNKKSKSYHIPVSMWVTATSMEEAEKMIDNIESNLKDSLGHCPYEVSLEYHKDDIEER